MCLKQDAGIEVNMRVLSWRFKLEKWQPLNDARFSLVAEKVGKVDEDGHILIIGQAERAADVVSNVQT